MHSAIPKMHCVCTKQLKMSVSVLSPNLCCRTAELTNIPNRHAQLLGTHASHFLIMLCMKISACMQRSSLICNFKDAPHCTGVLPKHAWAFF